MVFRVDDTDAERSTEEFLEDIIEGLRWLGLDWDEGIVVGGPVGEYRQSRRLARYQEVARQLVASGWAYYDFATPEQLEGLRAEAAAAGRSPVYDGAFRLPDDEAAARVAAGERAPIRFAVPRPGETVFTDAIRGELRFDHANVDDFVLLRSDGTPTYHLASSVDDVDHAITHIIRGEDLLPSTPKHILIAQAMGAPAPVYAHLSLLTGPDGAKLSKRHGATSLRAYRDEGILPEAMRNYLAILGWSPGTDEEIVSLETMVARFDLGAVSKNPAVFDVTKLEWMNGVYIRSLGAGEFAARALPFVEEALGRPLEAGEQEAFAAVAPLVQERARRLTEVGAQVRFLFADVEMDPASWQSVMTTPEAAGGPGRRRRPPCEDADLLGQGGHRGCAAGGARGAGPVRPQGPAAHPGGGDRVHGEPAAVRVARRPGQGAHPGAPGAPPPEGWERVQGCSEGRPPVSCRALIRGWCNRQHDGFWPRY